MPAADAITLLHVSDLQFGPNHRFARRDPLDPEFSFDTLLQRLCDDLVGLKKEHDLAPQLVVASGDLTEQGMPTEFSQARHFLEGLTKFLELGRDRVVLVPGNHDVNRRACRSYFDDCTANEQIPVPPFWPKWRAYAAMFEEFYKGLDRDPPLRFTVAEPWTWYPFPDLNLVVVGLNSTMAEVHDTPEGDPHYNRFVQSGEYGHFGRVGETQLRWFADRLGPFQEQGWLRIGVVHHNYRRGATRDDENLRDADDLQRLLGPHLNLLLHGHTHNARMDLMPNGVPIFSTGSAALTAGARPDEVPNQYQVIRIRPKSLERWTRRFEPDQKRWVADTRCSDRGDTGYVKHKVGLEDVASTFPRAKAGRSTRSHSAGDAEEKEPDPETRGDRKRRRPPAPFSWLEGLLDLVIGVCKLRMPGANVEPLHWDDPSFDYLLVSVGDDISVQQHLIGVREAGVTADDLDQFLRVDAAYRAADRGLRSEVVYGGEPAGAGLVEDAIRRGVRLRSFVEYQGLIDFRGYLERQTQRIASDPVYPPHLYVPQRMGYSIGAGPARTAHELARPEGQSEDALETVAGWLRDDAGRFVLVLGDFGTGKTFLLRKLAQRLAAEPGAPVPILIELRALQKALTLDALVAGHLVTCGEGNVEIPKFDYMVKQGRIALLFDGFDELAQRVTYDNAAEHFGTLLEAAGGQAKVVVTSRTQYFQSEQQVKSALLKRAEALPGLRRVFLRPFDEPQIRRFLLNLLGEEEKADRRLALIRDIRDLLGLAETPRMLSFIADLEEEQLRRAQETFGQITAAELYRLLLRRWLEYDYGQDQPRGAAHTLTVEERWNAVTQVALVLWSRVERTIRLSELTEVVGRAIDQLTERQLDPHVATHLVGARTLLVRDAEGVFAFVHQSVLEWLVANRAAEQLAAGAGDRRAVDALARGKMTPLMADFFCSLAGNHAEAWAQDTLGTAGGDEGVEVARENALLVLRRLGREGQRAAQLAGQDLRGKDFSGQKLHGANLAGADLTEASLVRADLTGANLEKAVLVRAHLTSATLARANLDGAEATGACLLGADLRQARLAVRSFRRASLVGAKLDVALPDCDLFGAALPDARDPEAVLSAVSECNAVVFSPDGALLATGCADGSVWLWEAETGQQLRALRGHRGSVLGVAFSPDGRLLAGGGEDGTVRLWEAATGRQLHALDGHRGSVLGVAFSPDGRLLASGDREGSMRLWEVQTGHQLRAFRGQRTSVLGMAFTPDGRHLASGERDGTLRLWEVQTGQQEGAFGGRQGQVLGLAFTEDGWRMATAGQDGRVRLWDGETGQQVGDFKGPQGPVQGLAFSRDRRWLAGIGNDRTVCLWESETGREWRVLRGHENPVRGVAFSPDGRLLASAGSDGTVRLWEPETGRERQVVRLHGDQVFAVAFNSDGRGFVSGAADKAVRLWEMESGRQGHALRGHTGVVFGVAVSPDGRLLASGGNDRTVRLWEAGTGRELHVLRGHESMVWAVAFSPDGRHLASGGGDQTVRLWEAETGRPLQAFRGDMKGVTSLAFSPNGRRLASGGDEEKVRLWNADTGDQELPLDGHTGRVWGVAFSPDGRWLASTDADQVVHLWDAEQFRRLRTLRGEGAIRSAIRSASRRKMLSPFWARGVAFGADGKWLAHGGTDGTISLWELKTSPKVRALRGHTDGVVGVAFSPDGRRLVSGGQEGAVRLWEVETGRLLATFLGTPDGWVAFTPDGCYKVNGNTTDRFWYAIGLCRFEPAELDDYLPPGTLRRLRDDEPLWAPGT
jgi:WD40 repeat protein/3',5'-cyclic AMP phosphodiesterase CpdA